MNPNDVGDALTIPLTPPAAQSFDLSCEIAQHLLEGEAHMFRHSWFPEDESY